MLYLLMLESLIIIISIAFIVTRIHFVRKMINQTDLSLKTQIIVILIFGLFGIIGSYTGITFSTITGDAARWKFGLSEDEAIINFRVMSIVTAGLLGGVRVGVGAGFIAGIHRYMLGGFSALACAISTIVVGFIAGFISKKLSSTQKLSPFIAAMIAIAAESIQMLIILVLAQPADQIFNILNSKSNAQVLVEHIALPMIVLNGVGCALFIVIVRDILREAERIAILQAKSSLRIARSTLKYMSQGLNVVSANTISKILLKESNAIAVAITNDEHILAHVGVSSDHHQADSPIKTQATYDVLRKGEMSVIKRDQIFCDEPSCLLRAAVIVPLQCNKKTVGTLKLFFKKEEDINNVVIEMVSGLSDLLSMQLNIAEADHQQQLAREANVKVILAEDVIHFLGNAMTALNHLIRTDKMKARQMVTWITNYVRKGLDKSNNKWTYLKDELEHVKNYLQIQEITYHDKLEIRYQIDNELLQYKIPPLILMTLVDNAIRHGIKNSSVHGEIDIKIKKRMDMVIISVSDSGEGISRNKLKVLGKNRIHSKNGTGLGLYNVSHLLKLMYGGEASLDIKSSLDIGTEVFITIPTLETKETINENNEIAYH